MSFFIQWAKKVTGSLPAPGLAKVIQVKDGDSFVIEQSDSVYEIRLSGVDCPELSQPYGHQSQMYLSDIIYKQCVFIDPEKFGKYHRVIAFAYLENACIAEHLIMSGNCWVYDKYAPANKLHFWLHLQEMARKNRYGLWAHSNPIEPRVWRSQYKFQSFNN